MNICQKEMTMRLSNLLYPGSQVIINKYVYKVGRWINNIVRRWTSNSPSLKSAIFVRLFFHMTKENYFKIERIICTNNIVADSITVEATGHGKLHQRAEAFHQLKCPRFSTTQLEKFEWELIGEMREKFAEDVAILHNLLH